MSFHLIPCDYLSFVKCYHGVNEGSLFPLKQGLLFMKPALFLPRSNIEEVGMVQPLDPTLLFPNIEEVGMVQPLDPTLLFSNMEEVGMVHL